MIEETIKGDCSVVLLRENADGSADFQFNFPPVALAALTRLGILTAIEAGIANAESLNPDSQSEIKESNDVNPDESHVVQQFTDEIKEFAEEAGFALWEDEEWKPQGDVVDWACKYDKELIKFYHLVKKKYS